ncbi:MAG: radical SAM family heme chaperone HemW [Pigmentiphaga sp.]|nr:radical SAM family heme chaperone HemW [Pigmentiphaga sp.]
MARAIPIVSELGRKAPGAAPGAVLTALPPLSLYIHVPWCVRKCPYCDFNSHALDGEIPEGAYLAALRRDLEQSLPQVWGRRITSVFLGGGTPSLLSVAAVDELLGMVRAYLPLLPEAEITMEANPGTAEHGRFQGYARAGVNRLSLGIQSFDDACLLALGRIHDGRQARAAIEAALAAVERVNLDLMTGLPGQDMAGLERDVRAALAFGTEHLSCYDLTLEPNTVFAKYPPPGLPDDDQAGEMQDRVEALLAEAGLERYEVSAYARPGARCRHNLNYWEFGDYLGVGPGAHGKLSFHDRIVRQARIRQPERWMQKLETEGAALADTRELTADDLPFEFMLNALRLRDGVPAAWFAERTGLSLAAIQAPLRRAVERGLLDADPTRLAPTPLGWRFLNDLQSLFL